jgi:hypothetical protein
MRRAVTIATLAVALTAMPVIIGCDREVGHTEKTTTNSNGTQTHSEQTTVQHPDGTTSTTTEKKSTNGNAQP